MIDSVLPLAEVLFDFYDRLKTVTQGYGSFDYELIGYRGWREHEHKAFTEFIEATGLRFEYSAYGLTYTLARITS